MLLLPRFCTLDGVSMHRRDRGDKLHLISVVIYHLVTSDLNLFEVLGTCSQSIACIVLKGKLVVKRKTYYFLLLP